MPPVLGPSYSLRVNAVCGVDVAEQRWRIAQTFLQYRYSEKPEAEDWGACCVPNVALVSILPKAAHPRAEGASTRSYQMADWVGNSVSDVILRAQLIRRLLESVRVIWMCFSVVGILLQLLLDVLFLFSITYNVLLVFIIILNPCRHR